MTRAYAKPTLTWQQQIAHLRSAGMLIDDDAKAEYWLRHVSYYRLSAYWLYFEHPKGQAGPRFRAGTTFDRVTALYDFDRLLRRLIMRGTEHVEIALRGSWAYQLGLQGDGHTYLDASLYSNRTHFQGDLAKVAGETGHSRETYIKHYREKYDVPPLPPAWMAAEMMSFGQLSRWYSNLADRSLRNRIAQPLGLPEAVLVPFIRHITDIRNICAHHGRLWNRQFLIAPKIAQKPDRLRNTLDQTATQAPAKLYNAACTVGHIVNTVAPDSSWLADLAQHVASNPENDLASMGFPMDWQTRPMWTT
ncbi:DNA-binding protein [Blastomonas sp. AAP25]|uniref:Abi family protein n=1 Tax=Blastomonas sp. AAP25 TaxID=1523416 RepID=UPI0006B89578|nr:Abi family protein [Blastomonas sp. AAP25]KPF77074.1 DNA-binding protein [Blastomonas sp. AAP25]